MKTGWGVVGGRDWGWNLGMLAAAALVAVPLAVIFSGWLHWEGAVWSHLAATVLPELVRNTAWLVVGVGCGVAVVGVGLAWLTAMCEFPGRRFLEWALIMPLAIPPYVLAFTILGVVDYAGPLQSWLAAHYGPRGYWFPEFRSTPGVIAVLVLGFYPYVYLLARGAFLSQGRRMLEAARVLGMGSWGAFFQAALPMARPAIMAGVALAVMETLADFGAVAVFNFDTFTTAIYKAWFGMFNLNAAAQLASLLVVVVGLGLAGEHYLRGDSRYFGTSGAGERIRLGGWGALAALVGAGGVFGVAFCLPLVQLGVWAARRAGQDLDERYWALVSHTVALGAAAAVLALAVALLLALGRGRGGGRWWRGYVVRVATLGYALPGSVLAVGMMVAAVGVDNGLARWFGHQGSWLNGSVAALLIAYLVRFLAVGFGPVESGLERIRPSLIEAAHSLGASAGEVVRRVYLPILRPSAISAILLVMVEVMKEMPATLLLRPFGWDTLAVKVFEFTSEGEWERAALPAVTLVLVGMAPVVMLVRRSAR